MDFSETTSGLFRLYAQDVSESANDNALNILRGFLGADTAAFLILYGHKENRLYVTDSHIPIDIAPDQRKAYASWDQGCESHVFFGPWKLPGTERTVPFWLRSELCLGDEGVGYLLVGRDVGGWGEEQGSALDSIARLIAPILKVRIEREHLDLVRKQVEEDLVSSEKRLRSFFEDSRDMIYTTNVDDIVTNINAAGIALAGRAKNDIIGKPFSALALNPQDRMALRRRVDEDGFASDFEIVLKKADGSTVFCIETAHAIKGNDGKVVEVQGILKDISERINYERELWKANLELAEVNVRLQRTQSIMVQQEKLASIGQLAAGVAHEINNPLGFLKSNHGRLEKHLRALTAAWGEAKSATGETLETIERNHKLTRVFSEIEPLFSESSEGFARIMRIVGNLKNFSRVEQGKDFDIYDVNDGIESTLIVAWNELKYIAEVKKILTPLPQIRARGGEVNQVILNLLVNAAQAIESQKRVEKGSITIETEQRGDYVVITIDDDGPGIPDSIRTKIFDPFFTTKNPGKGTGLGLSISYDIIVTKHAGRLTVDSETGKGARFTIALPVSGPPETDERDPRRSSEEST